MNKWCYWHTITSDFPNELTCLAHLADGRVFKCQYKSAEDRRKHEFPCPDYNYKPYIPERKNEEVQKKLTQFEISRFV